MTKLTNFIDSYGRLNLFPAKRVMKDQALLYLAQKIEPDRQYSEIEINELLNQWHTFKDPATLRRELYNMHLVDRERTGNAYWLNKE